MDQDSLTEWLVSGYAWVILHYYMFSAILEPQQSTQYEFISCRGHAWPTSQMGRGLTIYGNFSLSYMRNCVVQASYTHQDLLICLSIITYDVYKEHATEKQYMGIYLGIFCIQWGSSRNSGLSTTPLRQRALKRALSKRFGWSSVTDKVGVFLYILNFIHGQAILVIASVDQFLTYSRYYKDYFGNFPHFSGTTVQQVQCHKEPVAEIQTQPKTSAACLIRAEKGPLHQSEQLGISLMPFGGATVPNFCTDAPPNGIWALIGRLTQEKAEQSENIGDGPGNVIESVYEI
ncbi:uncharacterized protein B0H18DRAFT_956805 [Fomitopsis serialis]|uniref:uncharacterized protein n=1 Tax=Fomitopsis serialis TaxID=139415 RepID=UPI002007465E|nr:uncharacterized protein B0H18DRAFT_956805 [Neoantrodia serialis]KAH9921055.1 hypothetical protein B0H18DRAFT_956805 [Neoantrodia serialis]